jgi:aspartate-semialdehyde dehydrogenase
LNTAIFTEYYQIMRVAVVGATGMVGREMLRVLEERKVRISELIPVASEKSVGSTIEYNGNSISVVGMNQAISLKPDFALFSAGGSISLEYAPKFTEAGTVVIDNSSAWRMDSSVPLVVPEINAELCNSKSKIIANPNCSTIQLVMALYPLHQKFGINRVVISTYQSVSGTGKNAMKQLEEEESGKNASDPAYPYPIHRNCIPHCDDFLDNGYTKEEMKLVNESSKIMSIPELKLTATCVRVPINGGHSEAVNVSFNTPCSVNDIKTVLSNVAGLSVLDNPAKNEYPMPLNAHKQDNVYVGRIRKDESAENTFNLWIVADNLRKGAATNAVQILEHLIK